MISTQLFEGELVQLRGYDLEQAPAIEAGWSDNLAYARLRDPLKMRPLTALEFKEMAEADLRQMEEDRLFLFAVHHRADGRLLGVAQVYRISWNNGNARFLIALGETGPDRPEILRDVFKLLLRYCFYELNLHRVTLEASDHQTELVDCAKYCGMCVEVRQRNSVFMNGRTRDGLLLGMLRREWEEKMELP